MQTFDLICIGGGSGGIATARRAAEYGAKVAVIESGRLGGTCVNVGCVPKKLFWYAAHTAEALRDAPRFFADVPEKMPFRWDAFKEARDAYIARLNGIYETNLGKSGVTLIRGFACFERADTVRVGDDLYRAPHIVIATAGMVRHHGGGRDVGGNLAQGFVLHFVAGAVAAVKGGDAGKGGGYQCQHNQRARQAQLQRMQKGGRQQAADNRHHAPSLGTSQPAPRTFLMCSLPIFLRRL